jgi:hypothetical protein
LAVTRIEVQGLLAWREVARRTMWRPLSLSAALRPMVSRREVMETKCART